MLFSFSCATAETTAFDLIKHWLLEESLEINNLCSKLQEKLSKELKDEMIRTEFIRKINEIKEDEIKENATALEVLNNFQNKGIEEIIQAKVKELDNAIGEIYYCYPNQMMHSPFAFTFFIKALKKHGLESKFNYCLNKYYNMCNGLTKPGHENDGEILESIRSIIARQIVRIQNLESKLGELKSQQTVFEVNPTKIQIIVASNN